MRKIFDSTLFREHFAAQTAALLAIGLVPETRPGGAGQMIGPNSTLIFDVELVSIAGNDQEESGASAEG